jgi:hypothetical protein
MDMSFKRRNLKIKVEFNVEFNIKKYIEEDLICSSMQG